MAVKTKSLALSKESRRTLRTAYAYLLPATLIMALVTFFPLLYQLWMSFTNYSNLNLRTTSLFGQMVGSLAPSLAEGYNSPRLVYLANYARIVFNSLGQILSGFDFWRIVLFNLVWASTQVTVHVVLGVAIAMLLNSRGLWLKKVYRSLYIIPWALPGLVSAMIWKNMFDDQFGSVNQLLVLFGSERRLRWLQQVDAPFPWIPPFVRLPQGSNPWLALFILLLLLIAPLFSQRFRKRLWLIIPWALVLQGLFVLPVWGPDTVTASLGQLFPLSFYAAFIANAWLGWPFMMTVATGALVGIAHDYYEAAAIDGANGWQSFWFITVPLIRPAMVPAIMIGIMLTFNQFNVIYFITGGGPIHQTEILVTQAYRLVNETTISLEGVGNARPYGVAAAFSYIVFLILATITLITNRISHATEAYSE